MTALEPLTVDAVLGAIGDAAVLGRAVGRAERAGARAHEPASRGPWRLRENVDHAVDGVRAPKAAARPPNDFNAVDQLDRHVDRLPEHAGLNPVVNRSTVNEHEH